MVLQTARRMKVKPAVVIEEAKAAGLDGKGYWQLPKVAQETNNLKEAVQMAKEFQEGSVSSYISYPRPIHRRVRFLAKTMKVDTQAMLVDLIEIGTVAAMNELFSIKNPTKAKILEAWDRYIKNEVRERMKGIEVPATGITIDEKPEVFEELSQQLLKDQREKREALK